MPPPLQSAHDQDASSGTLVLPQLNRLHEAYKRRVNMTAWVHKECDTIEEETLDKLRAAWDSSEQKDECIVCLNDLERAYWTERVWYRHNQRWLQASKEGTETAKSGSFKDDKEWGKKCFEDLDQRRMGRPATRTWSTDFLLREGSSREEIGKWLKNKSIPWQRRRRLLQVVTGTFPCGQQMVKYGYKKTAECTLCKKAHEESGSSWNRELPKETIGHIQSAGCLGQKEVVIAAHNACIRELLQEVDGHGKAGRHMKLLTIETESSLGTLWDQEQCTQF